MTISTDSQILAVLHGAGGRFNALIARTNGTRPTIIDTRIFDKDQMHRLDGWLDEHQAGQVLVVLPGSTVVCRTCTLPKSDPIQLEQALQLQAEAHISLLAPPHRLASAVLHAAPEETTRCGLMIAWPESAHVDLPETSRSIRLTSDVVALASLLNGQRPANPLLWLDRSNGALALALTHANGAVFRCTCEDGETSETWQRNVGRAITETGLSVGHSDLFIDDVVRDTQGKIAMLNGTPAGLFLPEEIIESAASRVNGASREADWWMQFGIAVGAMLARCDQLQPLTEIQESPPIVKPSLFRSTFESLSRQKVATYCGVLCLLVLLFGPMLIHGLRLGVLKLRFSDIQTQLKRVENLENKRDMYEALGGKSWPMTKLLSDLATNTPESIDLDTIRINYDDGSLSVSGLAKPYRKNGLDLTGTEIIAQMQTNLEDSDVFTNTRMNWDEPNSFGHYEFSMTSRIARPFRIARYDMEHDYAQRTMQMRVDNVMPDGSGSGNALADSPSTGDMAASAPPQPQVIEQLGAEESPGSRNPEAMAAADSNDAATPRRGPGGRRTNSSDRGDRAASRLNDRGEGGIGLPKSIDIPEPLTKAQIEAMTIEEANTMLIRVAEARRHGRLDEETSIRLKDEFTMLIQHIGKLRKKN